MHLGCTVFQKELLSLVVLKYFGSTYTDHNMQQAASVVNVREEKGNRKL